MGGRNQFGIVRVGISSFLRRNTILFRGSLRFGLARRTFRSDLAWVRIELGDGRIIHLFLTPQLRFDVREPLLRRRQLFRLLFAETLVFLEEPQGSLCSTSWSNRATGTRYTMISIEMPNNDTKHMLTANRYKLVRDLSADGACT